MASEGFVNLETLKIRTLSKTYLADGIPDFEAVAKHIAFASSMPKKSMRKF